MAKAYRSSLGCVVFKGIFFPLIAMAMMLPACVMNPQEKPAAYRGEMDLRNWNFHVRGPVALDGQWEFYWGKLLAPKDFLHDNTKTPDGFIAVPGIWNGVTIGGKAIPGTGFATYRLRVHTGFEVRKLGIKMFDAATAYKIWVNGHLIASNGIVSDDARGGVPQYLPLVAEIPDEAVWPSGENGLLEIIIQVSNHHHRKGGLWESIRIGTYEQLAEMREHGLLLAFFIAGAIIIMGMYHLGLYLLRKKEIATLYFSILALMMSLRSFIINERILVHWFPSINWELLSTMEYITSFSVIAVIALFVQALYPEELRKIPASIIVSIGILYAILFIALKLQIYSMFKPAYDFYVLLGGGYVIYCLALASFRKRRGAIIALVGMSAFYFTGINDVLYNAQIINTTNLAPIGLFVYIFSQSHLLSIRFTRAMEAVEDLSNELSDLNKNLEMKVQDRMEELQAAFEELEAINEKLVETQNLIIEELELARKIQHQLIPRIPPQNLNIAAHYLPMEQVGGDFFDYIHFRDSENIGIFMSDVSGHGVPAALITSMLKSFILQAGTRKENPALLLEYLNDNIRIYAGGNFITAFYCICDISNHTLVYSNAGHNPPVLIENGSISFLDKAKSIPLGIMDGRELIQRGKRFENCERRVSAGGRLILYTDGISDVKKHDDGNAYYGDIEMLSFIRRNSASRPAEFIENLLANVRAYQGRDMFDDDICLICFDI